MRDTRPTLLVDPLQNLQVVEEDRYAALRVDPNDRYAALRVASTDRYAALRYAELASPRYAELAQQNADHAVEVRRRKLYGDMARPNRRRKVHHYFLTAEEPPPTGQLLWLPSEDFESALDDEPSEYVWTPGDVVCFNEAAVNRWANRWNCIEEDDQDPYLYATPIAAEVETYQPCDCLSCQVTELHPLLELAQEVRLRVGEDPARALDHLSRRDVNWVADWAGIPGSAAPPTRAELLAAIVTSPLHGLGGAALDYITWNHAHHFGKEGEAMEDEIVTVGENEGYVRRMPIEQLLLHSDNLHRDAPQTIPLWGKVEREPYQLFGDYRVTRVEYHSDVNCCVIAGWRCVYLAPTGEAERPVLDD